jgi:hypothetical protein
MPRALIGRRSRAVAAPSHRDTADHAGGDRVSMASIGMRRMRCGAPSRVAQGGSQWHGWASGPSHGSAVYGGVSFIEADHAADDGRRVWHTGKRGDDQPVGVGHDRGSRRAGRGSSDLRACAKGSAPR